MWVSHKFAFKPMYVKEMQQWPEGSPSLTQLVVNWWYFTALCLAIGHTACTTQTFLILIF